MARRAPAWAPRPPPGVHTRRGPTSLASPPPPSPSGKGTPEGLACVSPGLQQLHPLLQLLDVRLQVSVPGLGLTELTAGRKRP